MNSTFRSNPPNSQDMFKATNDVLSVDSDSDAISETASEIEFGAMDSLDLNDNEDIMVIAIDFGTTFVSHLRSTVHSLQISSSQVLWCRMVDTVRFQTEEHQPHHRVAGMRPGRR